MAFASVGSRGTAQVKTAGQTITISPSSTIAAGRLVAVSVAWDNNNTGTPDGGPLSEQHSCIDSVGNIYTTVVSGQNRGGSQAAGVHGSIHLCQLTSALTTTDTITVRLGTSNNLVAKSVSLWEYQLDADMRWAVADRTSLLSTAADPDAISLASLPSSTELLFLHVLAAEGPDTDTYTWDSDYTQITGIGTTGGTDDSNVHVRGGFRIATVTSDTVDVGSDTADRDYWQGLVAIYQFPYHPTFPSSELRDNFNRADEDPLDNGTWVTSSFIFGGTPGLAISTNQCKTGGAAAGWRGQWWGTDFSVDQEAWVTCATPATGFEDGYGIGTHGVTGDSATGFRALWQIDVVQSGLPEDGILFGTGDANEVTAKMIAWSNQSAGDKLGMNKVGSEVSLWLDKGSGWNWTCAFRDTSASGGKISLICRDQVVRVDDFGGGPIEIFVPQIYRREQE